MKTVEYKNGPLAILYDAQRMDLPGADQFESRYWAGRGALVGKAAGRGNTWFVDAPFGAVALRRYLRGGQMARLLKDRYFYLSDARSRPFREFRVLVKLHGRGLPVPRPLAALCEHGGILATGAIMTERIPGARTFAEELPAAAGDGAQVGGLWRDVGRCIRRFHDAGAWHADLNARNILVDEDRKVWLIDFDRARLSDGRAVNGARNLSRLKRSLAKLWPDDNKAALARAWQSLEEAYRA